MKCNGRQQQNDNNISESGCETTTSSTKLDNVGVSSKLLSDKFASSNRNDSGYVSCGHDSVAELELIDDMLSIKTYRNNKNEMVIVDGDRHESIETRLDVDSGLDVQIERFSQLNVDGGCDETSSIPSKQDVREVSSIQIESMEAWSRLCEEAFSPDRDGDTYLHLAIIHGRWDIISRLVQLSPHPSFLDFQNNLLQSPLHLAVLVNLPRTVRHLVLSGATLDVRNRVGNTPLHVACELGRIDCVRELLQPIALQESTMSGDCKKYMPSLPQDLEIRNYEGQMCVHLAALGNHLNILSLLRSYGANINAREGKSGRTALCLAIEARQWTLVSYLVGECSASVNEPTYAGMTPFQLAYAAGPHLAAALLRLGARPTQPVLSDTDDTDDSDYGSIADESMDTEVSEKLPTSKYLDLKFNGEPLW